jgi:hypothetical protein
VRDFVETIASIVGCKVGVHDPETAVPDA